MLEERLKLLNKELIELQNQWDKFDSSNDHINADRVIEKITNKLATIVSVKYLIKFRDSK